MEPRTPYRTLGAICLLLAVLLSAVALLLPSGFDTESLAAGGASAIVSSYAYTLSQLPLAVGLVVAMVVVARRAPVLASVAGALLLLGCFGHAVHGGVANVVLTMANDPANAELHTAVIEATYGGAQLPFSVVGLGGTVLGFLLLAVALLRSRFGPVWVPWALIVWVVVEFVGTGFVEWATYASLLLFVAGLGGLAIALLRRDPVVTGASEQHRLGAAADSLS